MAPGESVGPGFDVAHLRVQIRIAEQRLEQLDDFERRWQIFERRLSSVLEEREQRRLSYWGPTLAGRLKNAEDARLDLASRASTILPDCREPLAKLLRTSIQTDSPDLWELIGDVLVDEDGEVLVPADWDGPAYAVSARQFEITSQQARAEIARHRHELKAQIQNFRAMLDEAQAARIPAAVPAGGQAGVWSRVHRWIVREAHERGPLWALIGFLVTVLLGVLAL